MKRKTLLVFVLFCFMSILSAAGKYNGNDCKYTMCTVNKKCSIKKPSLNSPDFSLSPLQHLVFSM